MAKQQCFVCSKEMGWTAIKWEIKNYEKAKKPIPEGMTNNDKVCEECFHAADWAKLKQKEQEELEQKEVSDEIKQQGKQQEKEFTNYLLEEGRKLKPFWHKNNVIQYKDEYMAVLRKSVGAQVEFIVAMRDLTKEGYRLMAQDEGASAGGGGITGGISSYYYFQKIEFVTPNPIT